MPLQRSLVELPIQTGLQQKSDPRLVEPGVQTTLSNLVQDKIGALTKRPGIVDNGSTATSLWSNQLGAGPYNDARLLPSQPGGLAQISGARLWARGAADNVAYDLDSVPNVLVDEFGIQAFESSLTSFDMCTNGTKLLVVWTAVNASNVKVAYYAIYDATNYDTIQTPQQFATGADVQVVKCCSVDSTKAVIIAQQASVLQGFTLTWAGFTLSVATALTSAAGMPAGGVSTAGVGGLTFYGNWDLSPVQGVSNFIIALGARDGSNHPAIYQATFNLSLAEVALRNTAATASTADFIHGVAVIGSSTHNVSWVTYAVNIPSTNRVHAYATTIALSSVSTADTLLWTEEAGALPEQLTLISDPTVSWTRIFVCGCALSSNRIMRWVTFSSAATIANQGIRQGVLPAAKLFTLGTSLTLGLFYYNAGNPSFNGSTVLPSYYVCELEQSSDPAHIDLRPIATVGPRIANAGLYTAGGPFTIVCPNSSQLSSLQVLTAGSTIRNANTQSGIDIFNVRFINALYQPAILGDSTYISAGIPICFDGQRAINIGFPYQPPSVSAVIASSLGGGLSSYTYTYAAVYEWHSKTGERKQSQPTTTTYVSGTATGIASIQVPSINLSLEQDWESNYQPAIGVAIYRDTSSVPGLLCRAFAADVPASMLNQFNSTLTYTDSATDASIQGNEQLYTTGNVLGAQCPPSLSSIISHQGRLAGIGGDGLVWLTTKWDEGTTQPYFNDALTLAMGDFGRPTAIASMDGNLIVFKRDAIYLVGGDGPANDGTGNTWTPPQRITTDVGCSADWRGVVVFSGGVTFQNGAKLYVMTRGLEANYFSGAVEDLLIANPVITGAANHAARNELRFVCKPSELAEAGVVLNYNYVTETWSSFSYFDTDDQASGVNIDTCLVQGGNWYHGTFLGRVYQEGTGSFGSDYGYDTASNWIVGTRETAWLKSQGIQGFGRFWNAMVLETQNSPHDLTIAAAYNYGSLYPDSHTWTASEIASMTTNQPQMQLHLTQQKSESMRVKIYDGPPTGVTATSGQGANIVGVSVEAGVKRGRFRIPEAQAK